MLPYIRCMSYHNIKCLNKVTGYISFRNHIYPINPVLIFGREIEYSNLNSMVSVSDIAHMYIHETFSASRIRICGCQNEYPH